MRTIEFHNTHIYIEELPTDITPLLPLCSHEIQEKIKNVSSFRRKREIIASHLMIKEIFNDKVSIIHDEYGAPTIIGINGYISISHSATEIVIAYNQNHRIGIDIENWREQLIKVKSRFLSQKEIEIYASPQLMLQAWTIKEALYKVAQSPGISLDCDILLPTNLLSNISKVNTTKGICQFSFYIIESTPTRCITLAEPL